MKNLTLISLLIFLVFTGACDVLSSFDKQIYDYQFKTDKTTYSLEDTVYASFKNKSDQTLFLDYQMCTVTDMQKHENEQWKSVPIPLYCTAEVKTPIQVEPGENFKTGIALPLFDKDSFERGTYRLNVLAKHKNESQSSELTSNNFEITN